MCLLVWRAPAATVQQQEQHQQSQNLPSAAKNMAVTHRILDKQPKLHRGWRPAAESVSAPAAAATVFQCTKSLVNRTAGQSKGQADLKPLSVPRFTRSAQKSVYVAG